MPILDDTPYRPPWICRNPHVHTIVPLLFRRVTGVRYVRETMVTPDGDFLQGDWSKVGSHQLAILSHGLEGDSKRPYMLGMVRTLNQVGIDTLSWNFRGCGGAINQRLRFTHSGATEDLAAVIDHVLQSTDYPDIFLVGFSIGGNLTLKYLGERRPDPRIRKAVALSVPCELESAAHVLARPSRKIYMLRFLIQLRQKMKALASLFPDQVDLKGYGKLRSFLDFDARYTAPLHGFPSAHAYWRASSSKYYLQAISIPTLLLNAKDDPFLSPPCFPREEATRNPYLWLQVPDYGGHVGFVANRSGDLYWSERSTLAFLTDRKG